MTAETTNAATENEDEKQTAPPERSAIYVDGTVAANHAHKLRVRRQRVKAARLAQYVRSNAHWVKVKKPEGASCHARGRRRLGLS